MTIFEKVVAQNIQYNSHRSDLYIPVNKETKRLIAEYEFKENVTKFKDAIDNEWWFDIPFAYDPFWKKVPGC